LVKPGEESVARVPSEVRRQQFIEAAVKVIARDGVDGATTRRIAEEANAPLATLHYCFQTKENLLWAVFEKMAEFVRADIAKARGSGLSITELAAQMVNQSLEWAIENPEANRTQIEIWLWAERNDLEFAVRLYQMFIDAWKDFLGAAQPPFPDDELETVTRVIVAILDGLCMQLITHGDNEKVRREAKTAGAMLAAYFEQA
jgi:AcrR family transcriptional regulator